MADYDSDSSQGEFDETNVLLGYASKDASDDTISRIGGRPEWLDKEEPPSAALAKCKVCGAHMALLLQLNGELPDRFPGHERRIYVFACRGTGCRRREGSVRAVRAVRKWADDGDFVAETEVKQGKGDGKEEEQSIPRLGDALFGAACAAGPNPFSSSASGTNPFSSNPTTTTKPKTTAVAETEAKTLPKTFAETLTLNTSPPPPNPPPPTPPEPWPAEDSSPEPYPTLYLAEADYETLDPAFFSSSASDLPSSVRVEDADAPETVSAADREAFESTMDRAFQRFADRLAQNPEQVIRYEFGGAPLLSARADAVGRALGEGGVPRCGACGAGRVFEVQLMPYAITLLEEGDEGAGLDGIEWATVVVAVCGRDCGGDVEGGGTAYLEEWAGVQWEEGGK